MGCPSLRWSSLKSFMEYAVGRNPDKLVIIHSRGDVLYGGCSENIIKFKYEEALACRASPLRSRWPGAGGRLAPAARARPPLLGAGQEGGED